jgi:hypothetical protein
LGSYSFSYLYFKMRDYEGGELYEDAVEPFIQPGRETLKELRHYRRLNTPERPYEVRGEDLWEWYAINRVNDYLLLGFQQGVAVDWEAPFQDQDYQEYMRGVLYRSPCDWSGPSVTAKQYQQFFGRLGFRLIDKLPFSPFFHEVVEVIQDEKCGADVTVEEVFWPG